MLKRIGANLTYANVMATVAVFIALGGSSYAVVRVTSDQIADGTIRGRDVKPNALTGRQVAEGRLGRVPHARVADLLREPEAKRLRLRCPAGTNLAAGLCFEIAPHLAATYFDAAPTCGAVNQGNRRLPTVAELVAYFAGGGEIVPGGELTSNVFESRAVAGRVDVLILQDERGNATSVPAIPLDPQGGGTVRVPFRCVTSPTNVP